MYPVIVISAGPHDLLEVEHLFLIASLEEAKDSARIAAHHVIDVGEGGNCETTYAWDGEMAHLVTVEAEEVEDPNPRRDEEPEEA